MTLDAFIKKYNGKGVDFDGSYGNQCVDLARQYWKEVIGLKAQPKGVVGAKDFWTNFATDPALYGNFEKIANSKTNYPQAGDTIIWGAKYGKYGHIAVATYGDVHNFSAFSQNDPIGTLAQKRKYDNYKGVEGWFRPLSKAEKPTASLKETVIDFDDAEGKRKTVGFYVYEWDVEKRRANEAEQKLDSVREQSSAEMGRLNDAIGERNARIHDLELELEAARTRQPTLQEAIKVLLSSIGVK